jgi:hypothetical protein
MGWTFYSSTGQKLSTATASAALLDIDGSLDEMGAAIVDADLLIIDDADGGNKSVLASRIKTYVEDAAGEVPIANLNIDGGTDIGAAIIDEDLFIVDDGAGGTNRKTTAGRIKTYVGGLSKIGTVVASSSATLDITGLDSTYDTYMIVLSDILPATDGQSFWLRVGDSSGFDSGSTDYSDHLQNLRETGAGYAAANHTGAAQMEIANEGVGNATGEGYGAVLYIHRPGDGTTRPQISGHYVFCNSSGAVIGGIVVGQREAVITLDRIQVLSASGNITSGRLTVFGLSHA